MSEIWNPVFGYERSYEVSDAGRVRSITRIVANGHRWYGRILKSRPHKFGYPVVHLRQDGKNQTREIHRLVLESFIGSPPTGMECCHNDGNPRNNQIDNLRWDTRSNNLKDKAKHGTNVRGERCSTVKLCELDVWLIRAIKGDGNSLARFFDVHNSTISNVRTRRTWSHV